LVFRLRLLLGWLLSRSLSRLTTDASGQSDREATYPSGLPARTRPEPGTACPASLRSVGASRFVYNWGLAESQRVYRLTGRRPALGELRRQLAYKSEWYGATVVIADRFYPSSKTCSSCGVSGTSLTSPSGCSSARPAASVWIGTKTPNLRRLGPGTATGGSPGSYACGEEGSGANSAGQRETTLAEAGSVRKLPDRANDYAEARGNAVRSWG
jgi:hypothetical protein